MVSCRSFIGGFCIFLLICSLLALIIFKPFHSTHSPKLPPKLPRNLSPQLPPNLSPRLPPKLSPKLPLELSPEFRADSNTTTVSLNFTGQNLTIEGDITIYFSNPSNSVDIFYDPISVYVYYNVTDNSQDAKFLGSTYFPSIYIGANHIAEGYCRSTIYNSTTVKNTLDVREAGSGGVNFFITLWASVSFNGSLFNPNGYLLKVVCYPLHSHVSSNVTSNATTVLLNGLSC